MDEGDIDAETGQKRGCFGAHRAASDDKGPLRQSRGRERFPVRPGSEALGPVKVGDDGFGAVSDDDVIGLDGPGASLQCARTVVRASALITVAPWPS